MKDSQSSQKNPAKKKKLKHFKANPQKTDEESNLKNSPKRSGGIVNIFTDGSCQRNPGGAGGIGIVLRYGKNEICVSEGYFRTTNNRMEMLAAIRGLQCLNRPCDVVLYSDSQYLIKGVTQWMKAWKRKGWKTVDKKPVKNQDLWIELDKLIERHSVRWIWVKGHAGHSENEVCDVLAKKASSKPTLVDSGFE